MQKVLIYIIGAIILVSLGVAGAMLIMERTGNQTQEAGTNLKESVSYDPDGAFITNIKDSKKLIKVSIVIEMEDNKKIDYMTKNNYKIRNIINDVLSGLSEEDIGKDNARDDIRADIREEIRTKLSLDGIIDVYFNEFVTQ